MPTSIRRDGLAWTPIPSNALEVFRPPTVGVPVIADILPFPRVASNDCQWPVIWNSDAGDLRESSRHIKETRGSHHLLHSTYRMDSPSLHQPVFVTVMPAFNNATNSNPPIAFCHSTSVLHGGHLMHYFGIRVVALLTLQLVSAWKIGAVAGQSLGASGYLHSATWLCVMLTFNLWVWFHYYGRESKAFHVPGIGLFLAAILPVFLLQLLALARP